MSIGPLPFSSSAAVDSSAIVGKRAFRALLDCASTVLGADDSKEAGEHLGPGSGCREKIMFFADLQTGPGAAAGGGEPTDTSSSDRPAAVKRPRLGAAAK
ncbi:MAG: hypothetical protein NTW94_04530 [Legionellales bacterium]|nr:hypothetical protein [Legionellales bacterium]